ncbi:MAG: aconitase X catalytic domain-containing protein, partial [Candidatus Hydrothermarchaeales archaeon]
MYLTKEEEGILEGESGDGLRRAMELLVALGDIKDASGLVSIASAHVSGVSYKTIGEAGLELLHEWAATGTKVRVPTTSNPAGVDLEAWQELGFPRAFAEKQKEIIDVYHKMGVQKSCTCTPYLAGNQPTYGADIAWAESSAVAFANSVLGARTNRESGISALAAAMLGKIPCYGLHLEENRRGTFIVEVEEELRGAWGYSAMGYHVAKMNGIPIFKGIRPSMDEMKVLGAALATGGISMFHVEGVTPDCKEEKVEKLVLGRKELADASDSLNTCDGDVDIVCIGCPHCSRDEILEISKLKPSRETWVF